MITTLKLDDLRDDGGTQPRDGIDYAAVEEYSDAMTEGAKFPPVVVFYDGSDYWLADGFHRVKAAYLADHTEIACEVHQGTREDAQWCSFGANKTNGIRRSNNDKQRALQAALKHPKSQGLSDHQIARHIGVAVSTVGDWRKKLSSSVGFLQIDTRTVTRNGATYQQNTVNIGRQGSARPEPCQVAPPPTPSTYVCAACGAAFAALVWHCAACGHHWPMDVSECRNCRPENPPAPIATDTADAVRGAADHEAAEWSLRVHRACVEIAGCPMPAKDLAASLRRGNSNQLTEQLEKAHEFIAAVLAEAVVD